VDWFFKTAVQLNFVADLKPMQTNRGIYILMLAIKQLLGKTQRLSQGSFNKNHISLNHFYLYCTKGPTCYVFAKLV
jgi:hypothetical protein